MQKMVLLIVLIAALMFVCFPAWAQNDPEPSDEPETLPEPEVEPVEEADSPDTEPEAIEPWQPKKPLPPHWINYIWRSGLGANGSEFLLKYRDVPEDEEDTFEATGGGSADMHMFSAWFFPTRGRQFMITFGVAGGSANGEFSTEENDDEFLDSKQFWYSYWYTPIGIGYRWLLGSRDQVSLNLFGEMGWMRQTLHLEGAEDSMFLNGGGGGIVLGAHYRYDNGFLLGGAFEARGYGAAQKDTRLAGVLVDGQLSGNMIVFSLILGYEPGRKGVAR